MTMGKRLKVTQTGSTIARPPLQAKVLKGLGLGRIGKAKELEDTAAIRGMIAKVVHLVAVEELK
jgi:large subunit ribosomal protein L30